jgi:acyl carrier protein
VGAPPDEPSILEPLLEFLNRTFPASAPVFADSELPDVVLQDSLAYLEVVMFLEKRYGARFDAGDLDGEAFATPAALARLTRKRLGGAS